MPGDAQDGAPLATTAAFVRRRRSYPRIVVAEHGKLPGSNEIGAKAASEAIQREIVRAGPVTCNLDAEPLLTYLLLVLPRRNPPNGRGANDTDHVVEVVGWGVADGKPYWEISNSWGEYWGEAGFGKVLRGVDDSMIESSCTYADVGGWGAPGVSFQAASDDEGRRDRTRLHAGPGSGSRRSAPVEPERAALVLLVAVVAFFVACLMLRRRCARPILRSLMTLSKSSPLPDSGDARSMGDSRVTPARNACTLTNAADGHGRADLNQCLVFLCCASCGPH